MLNESIASEVRAEMARRSLTQTDLAARLGWNQSMLSRRLSGEVAFSTTDIEQLANALSVPLGQLTSPRAS
jgi:transcriptional regulator with XRE-family HTH domain